MICETIDFWKERVGVEGVLAAAAILAAWVPNWRSYGGETKGFWHERIINTLHGFVLVGCWIGIIGILAYGIFDQNMMLAISYILVFLSSIMALSTLVWYWVYPLIISPKRRERSISENFKKKRKI